jgi:predicted TIM-barrel fold metal-dependent hydrolase
MASVLELMALPKVDGHCHVLDPQGFPYSPDAAYHPIGQEVGTADYYSQVMDAYGTRHALLVGPNSGYGLDNRCLLAAIAQGQQNGRNRFKGIAVVPQQASIDSLEKLKAQGVIGVAFNVALQGLPYYLEGAQNIEPLMRRLAALDMWAQFQVEADQLVDLMPLIERTRVKVMIDHCGRPRLADGLQAPGVQALLALGRSGQGVVKLSGFGKFSEQAYPFADTLAHVHLLVRHFGVGQCIWASDWPHLKSPYRLDYGTLLQLAGQQFGLEDWRQMMWETPQRLLGFC